MNLRDKRNKTNDLILQGRFIEQTLRNECKEIDLAIDAKMAAASFSSDFWSDKDFTVQGKNTLEYRHKKQHRFVDMKTRSTASGSIRKKRHAIHNKIIYGHLNNIARELSHGYTDAVVEQMKKIED